MLKVSIAAASICCILATETARAACPTRGAEAPGAVEGVSTEIMMRERSAKRWSMARRSRLSPWPPPYGPSSWPA